MSNLPEKEKEAYISFSAFPLIGPARFSLLKKYFGSAKMAWAAKIGDYIKIGFSQKLASDFEKFRQNFDLKNYQERLNKFNIGYHTIEDKTYPERLKNIDDAPFLIYYLPGKTSAKSVQLPNLDQLSQVSLAVVGTRKMSAYGREVTEKLVTQLVDNGLTIISGLALGIDAIAHKTALSANGTTIGVLGNGLNKIYPPSNTHLAQGIITSGCGFLVSEYPLDYPAMPQNFPTRNRIISGLSLAVLVIEGTDKSGTLLTASLAAKQGRDVFAVPGPVTSPTSRAPHILIKQGAKLVEKVEDILEELDISSKLKSQISKLILPGTKEEEAILKLLSEDQMDIDGIIRSSNLTSNQVLSTLTAMELKGMVKNIGGTYVKV